MDSFLEKRKLDLREAVRPFEKYWQSGEKNFRIGEERIKRAIIELRKKFKGGKASRIDGLKISFPEWWFNLRKSGTEELARLNVEAVKAETGRKRLREIEGIVKD